jgi:DNA-binding XRE family transcriptional regulator
MSEQWLVSLAACRANAQKTQKEWAELLGVSKATVVSWEAGNSSPKFTQVQEISRLSGIPIQHIIFVPKES